jgi:uncharacterized membrane protein YuzA (DUF378 family)
MKNIISILIHYFDTIDDTVDAILGIFSVSIITAVFGSMLTFISSEFIDYLLVAFFGVVGQTSMYFAKIRFPYYFGKHDDKRTIGTKMLHYSIDCFLAALFAVICTEYLIDFIFTTLAFIQNVPVTHSTDYKRTIIGAIIIGAFYETILKKAIKKNKEIDEDINNGQDIKIQSLDGEPEPPKPKE